MSESRGKTGTMSLIAFALMLLGAVLAIWGCGETLNNAERFPVVNIPSNTTTIDLAEGTHTIFYEKDDGPTPSAEVLAARVRISDPDRRNVPVKIAATNKSVRALGPSDSEYGGALIRDLQGLLTFEATHSGDYKVRVETNSTLPPGRLAVGPGVSFAKARLSLWAMIGGPLLAFCCLIAVFELAFPVRSTTEPVPPEQDDLGGPPTANDDAIDGGSTRELADSSAGDPHERG